MTESFGHEGNKKGGEESLVVRDTSRPTHPTVLGRCIGEKGKKGEKQIFNRWESL